MFGQNLQSTLNENGVFPFIFTKILGCSIKKLKTVKLDT